MWQSRGSFRLGGPRWPPVVLTLVALGLWGCDGGSRAELGDRVGGGAESSAEAVSDGVRLDAAKSAADVDSAEHVDPVRDVVLITVDTLRWDAVGFAPPGPWRTPTPTLERLADKGRVFTQAVAHAPLTLPSHAAMLTGLYPYQHGVRENAGFRLQDEHSTLAEQLQGHGFETGAFVSAFVLDRRFGLAQGFNVYGDAIARDGGFGVSERRGDETVAEALTWWQAHSATRRFLWLHLFDPHAPYELHGADADQMEHPYRAEVAAVDKYLAPLLEPLLDASSDALVIFTSDHGESLGDHGEETHGIFAYQSTLRVPLVLWGPGVNAGTDDRLARHVDLMPTVLRAVGLAVPEELPGRALTLPPASRELQNSYFEALSGNLNRGWAPLRGWIEGGTKYIDLPLAELYDLANDPEEKKNLVQVRRRELPAWGDRLPEESTWPPGRGQLSREEIARLRSLGYVSGDGSGATTFKTEDDPKRLIDLDRDIHRFSEAFAAGELDEAVALARSLVARRPSMSVAHTLLAQALLESGRSREALEAMELARGAGRASPALLRQLGLTLMEAGRPAEAIAVLEPTAEASDPEAMAALAAALSETGTDRARAQALIKDALELAPNDGGLRQTAAVMALRHGDGVAGLRHAREATRLSPQSAAAWNHLGVALMMQARPLEALEAWQRSVSLDADQFDTLFNLGTQAARLGEVELARRYLEDFLHRAPRDRYASDLPKVEALLRRLP